MGLGELPWQKAARLARQVLAYPELSWDKVENIAKVDQFRASVGRPLSSIGQAMESFDPNNSDTWGSPQTPAMPSNDSAIFNDPALPLPQTADQQPPARLELPPPIFTGPSPGANVVPHPEWQGPSSTGLIPAAASSFMDWRSQNIANGTGGGRVFKDYNRPLAVQGIDAQQGRDQPGIRSLPDTGLGPFTPRSIGGFLADQGRSTYESGTGMLLGIEGKAPLFDAQGNPIEDLTKVGPGGPALGFTRLYRTEPSDLSIPPLARKNAETGRLFVDTPDALTGLGIGGEHPKTYYVDVPTAEVGQMRRPFAGGGSFMPTEFEYLVSPKYANAKQPIVGPLVSNAAGAEDLTKVGPGGVKPQAKWFGPPIPEEQRLAGRAPFNERLNAPVNESPVGTLSGGVDNPVTATPHGLTPAGTIAAAIQQAAEENRAALGALRSQQAGRYGAVLEGVTNEASARQAMGALAGQAGRTDIAPLSQFLDQAARDAYFRQIARSDLSVFDKATAHTALADLIDNGRVPAPAAALRLQQALGGTSDGQVIIDAIAGIKSGSSLLSKAGGVVADLANLPRTVTTAFDFSAPVRQGAALGPGHPREWAGALDDMFRAAASEGAAQSIDDVIRAGPLAGIKAGAGLYYAPLDVAGAELGAREEGYMSALASKIPGIKGSQRAYTTFLNKLRSDVFDSTWNGLAQEKQTMENARALAHWINIATGRGDLGLLKDAGPLLNAMFFSPRYLASRVELPFEAFRTTPALRGQVAGDTVKYVGTGIALLTLASLGGANVEKDPRSSDFGKIRVGGTRLDIWGGESQMARLVAQMITDEKKSTGTGSVSGLNRAETVGRFLQSKLSPAAGLGVDLLRGETYQGDQLSLDKTTLGSQAWNRLAPMFLQDLVGAVQGSGAKGAALAIPGAFGVGVQTYDKPFSDVRDEATTKLFPGRDWGTLNRDEQHQVLSDPAVIERMKAFKEDSGSSQQQTSFAMTNYDRRKTEEEQALRARIDGGTTGQDLRDAINTMNTNRYQASLALLKDTDVMAALDKGKDKKKPSEDVFAEAYWSVPAPTNAATGEVDFDTQKQGREAILAEARKAGANEKYISGTGDGTYRGERFTDPKVREAVAQLDALRSDLDKTGYFGLRDKAWEELKKQHPAQLGDLSTFKAFHDTELRDLTQKMIGLGVPAQLATMEAEKKFATYNTVTAFNNFYRTEFRHSFVVDNPDLATKAVQMGYLNPDDAERRFLRSRTP